MSAISQLNTLSPKVRKPPLLYLLAFVFVLFIGILIFCYVVTKRSNPVVLDSQGHPVTDVSHH